MIVSKPRIRFR